MEKKNQKEFSKGLASGALGAILALAITVAIVVWLRPFDYKAVVIVQQEQRNRGKQPVLTIPEKELFNSMRNKGVLLTPAEYTNNMISYYNTLIAFLAIFFVVFTVFGYIAIRSQSKKEIKEEARDILLDSATFRKDVIETIRGDFDQAYLSHEEYDEMLNTMQEAIASLKNCQEAKDEENTTHKKQTVKPKATSKVKVTVSEAEASSKKEK
jgi:hypothetical protein